MSQRKISARSLVKSYRGRRVVDGVSLDLASGEIVGLLGPNGAGKTTTFYMVVGLVDVDEGEVTLDDLPLTRMPMYERARRGVGYLAQEPSVFRKLSARDNILAVLDFLDIPDGERGKMAMSSLEEFGVAHLADAKAYSLSGGERRRVEIARALATRPSFLLLDEPFSGIDPIAVEDIQDLVKGLKKRGIGILVTDHNVEATLGICDRAYIIDRGRILEAGSPAEIASSGRVREVYLGERFRL